MSSKTSQVVSLPLASLVEDFDVYPRHAVDGAHVTRIVMALEAGKSLPPIRADKKSKIITDGWHRGRAYNRFLGADATVDVELVPYATRAEMALDAVQSNTAHGRPLDAIDSRRSIILLREVGFNDGQIALALHVPERRIEKFAIKVATASKSAPGVVPGTNKITLKRCVSHMQGQRLTKTQAEAHVTLPGTSFLLVAKQLCLALQEQMIDLEDKRLVEQLTELQGLLNEALV